MYRTKTICWSHGITKAETGQFVTGWLSFWHRRNLADNNFVTYGSDISRTLSEGNLFARIYHERCIMAVPFFVQSSDDMLLAGSHTLTWCSSRLSFQSESSLDTDFWQIFYDFWWFFNGFCQICVKFWFKNLCGSSDSTNQIFFFFIDYDNSELSAKGPTIKLEPDSIEEKTCRAPS